MTEMNGAESMVRTLVAGGVDVCFANPGTSEMHFVAALDKVPEMRCILGLFEGVVTGAADGYCRMKGSPAATLLHLGPGLANGLANIHNARKAGTGMVNIVGEHATGHLALDAPLTADIQGLARPLSHWVHTVARSADAARDTGAAIEAARQPPGQIATLVLPADCAWGKGSSPVKPAGPPTPKQVSSSAVQKAAQALKRSAPAALILGGPALRGRSLRLAGMIAGRTGCALMCENLNARLERGAGRVQLERIPYSVDAAVALLRPYGQVVIAGAKPPIAFFAYPDKPGVLTGTDTSITLLGTTEDDLEHALEALAAELGATEDTSSPLAGRSEPLSSPNGSLTAEGIARVLCDLIPDDAIVIDESVTSGRSFAKLTASARPHDWLNSMGGSIGFGLPLATGAAVAAPGRKVLALEGDGSAMYTPQALWTMVREQLDVTVLVFANHSYQILNGELANVGGGTAGPRARSLLSLEQPRLDWLALARGHAVEAGRATDLGELARELRRGIESAGPYLIELEI